MQLPKFSISTSAVQLCAITFLLAIMSPTSTYSMPTGHVAMLTRSDLSELLREIVNEQQDRQQIVPQYQLVQPSSVVTKRAQVNDSPKMVPVLYVLEGLRRDVRRDSRKPLRFGK